MDLLKYRAMPELAAAVRAAAPDVIERWVPAVGQTLPTAAKLNTQQIQNDIPKILDRMAAALEAGEPRPTRELEREGTAHGESRFDADYDVGELMTEYAVFRRILIEEVAARLSREMTVDESAALNLGVDVAIRRSIVEFAAEQRAELQAVAEAQSKYLSFLSHDLRGGLNGVLLMIEVLRRDLAKEERFADSLDDLDMMRRSILETVGTMDRFLHAERFRKGKVQVKPAPVRVQQLVNEVVTQFSYQARDKALELRPEVQEGTAVTTDRELLALILQNLVANAVKFSKQGVIRVVATTTACPAGVACRLSVIDQGPGITPQKLDELFSPFQRGDTHGQPGTGLGLSIARQAADLVGARIRAESAPGEGSTFHVDLPNEPPKAVTLTSDEAKSAKA
jgi:signal transduction histidine kinase